MTRAVGAAVLWVRDCARRCGRPRAAPLLLLSGLSRRDPPPGRREYDIGKFVERRAYNICASLLCYLFSDSVFKNSLELICYNSGQCGQ